MGILALLLILCAIAAFVVETVRSGFSLIALGLTFFAAYFLVNAINSVS